LRPGSVPSLIDGQIPKATHLGTKARDTASGSGVTADASWGEELWARFFTEAPAQHRRFVERFNGALDQP
jgi:hypothetical protein